KTSATQLLRWWCRYAVCTLYFAPFVLERHATDNVVSLLRPFRASHTSPQYADVFNPQREANENFVYMATTDRYAVGVWGNLTKNPRHKSIDFADLKMSTGLSKPLALANVAIVMLMQMGACAAAEYDQYIDSTSTAVVGGVLNLMLAEMPEVPKTVDKWTIRQRTVPATPVMRWAWFWSVRLEYRAAPTEIRRFRALRANPFSVAVLTPTSHLKRIEYPFPRQATDPAEEDTDDATWAAQWPTQITHALPKGVFLHPDSVTVKYWSAENKRWQDDGVEDNIATPRQSHQLTSTSPGAPEHNQVRFRTIHFKPSAVVQDAFSELPYAHWHMRPSTASPNLITLTISGKSQQIQVEIGEQGCRLLAPVVDSSELNDPNINKTWMSASLMFKVDARRRGPFFAIRNSGCWAATSPRGGLLVNCCGKKKKTARMVSSYHSISSSRSFSFALAHNAAGVPPGFELCGTEVISEHQRRRDVYKGNEPPVSGLLQAFAAGEPLAFKRPAETAGASDRARKSKTTALPG
ncbi:MAG: hypothetical protein BJ554DRAFT_7855, partial [Olpidium bornovanus]